MYSNRMNQTTCIVCALLLLVLPCIGMRADANEGGTADGNVKRYGAVGDGKTDDTAAFQKALDGTSLKRPFYKALKGQNVTAQGNALGNGNVPNRQALKGRHEGTRSLVRNGG